MSPSRQHRQRQSGRSNRLYEQLEERILFDAVPDASLELEGLEDAFAPAADATADLTLNAATSAAEQSPQEVPSEIVFVDKKVNNYQLFVADLIPLSASLH